MKREIGSATTGKNLSSKLSSVRIPASKRAAPVPARTALTAKLIAEFIRLKSSLANNKDPRTRGFAKIELQYLYRKLRRLGIEPGSFLTSDNERLITA